MKWSSSSLPLESHSSCSSSELELTTGFVFDLGIFFVETFVVVFGAFEVFGFLEVFHVVCFEGVPIAGDLPFNLLLDRAFVIDLLTPPRVAV